jgi:hypothetical protein
MIASRSFWGISPCIDETVKSAARIFSVNQSTYAAYSEKEYQFNSKKGTLRRVLQKMTACVMVRVS